MGNRITQLLVGTLGLCVAFSAGHAHARTEALLSPSRGHLPTDTATEATKCSLEQNVDLGGTAVKVVFATGESFGDRISRVKNWKEFIRLQFDAVNPGQANIGMTLTVKHRRTTSYQTRVDVLFTLKPGKNSITLGVDEMLNVNGSVPDLTAVEKWYIACAEGTAPTVYFGDIVLVGDDAPAARSAGRSGVAAGPPVAYRVRGFIGDKPVDLMVEPILDRGASAEAQVSGKIKTDPARLARIRAAKMPGITKPVMFNTPEADAILSALEVFPPDNPWNQLVEDWPVHPDSDAMIASIGADKPLRYNPDMSFILVPPDQKRVDVKIRDYPGESDSGPYPVPDNIPIEGWPGYFEQFQPGKVPSLDEVQRGTGGDRHGLVVDPVNRTLYEFFVFGKTDSGWQAAQASIFDLKTNELRPLGWTSADAAGLPIFPAVVRYDEIQRGLVEHAMRVTIRKTRRDFVAPATHYASPHTNPEYPRMGERLRLKADFDISGFSPPVQAILKGLQRYGMLVADNGIEWAISVAPDPRIPNMHEELREITGSDFEVVVSP